MPAGVDRVSFNGVLKDYDPPSGINNVSEIVFDPGALPYAAGIVTACPQGDSAGFVVAPPGDMTDTIWDGRSLTGGPLPGDGIGNAVVGRTADTGFGTTVKSSSGNRYFTTNTKVSGVSGGVEPTGAGLDGGIGWNEFTYRGAWAPLTVYAIADRINAAGFSWRCIVGGTSNGPANEPAWPPSTAGSSATADDGNAGGGSGDFVWVRTGVYQGDWAATTTYGLNVYNNGGGVPNIIMADAVSLAGTPTKMLRFSYTTSTIFGVTVSEPSWSAATSASYYVDGNNLFASGSTLFPTDPLVNGSEQLVLTGLLAPSQDGKTIRISNSGVVGSNQQVVLADNAHLTDILHITPFQRVQVDAASAAANSFSFGGLYKSVYIRAGQYVLLKYSAANAQWTWANYNTTKIQQQHISGRGGGW